MSRVVIPIAERIKALVEIDENGCWIWQGSKMRGYGRLTVGSRTDGTRRTLQTHRASYQEFVGPIPEGMQIDHLCRTPACCNPDHLEPVTHLENARRVPPRSVCPYGHEMNSDNEIINARGARMCLTCRRRSNRESERKRTARLRAQKAG